MSEVKVGLPTPLTDTDKYLSAILRELEKNRDEIRRSAFLLTPESELWEWRAIEKTRTLGVGEIEVTYDEKRTGYLYYALIASSSPDLRIVGEMYGETIASLNNTLRELEDEGDAASIHGTKILKWDDFNFIYTLEFAPGLSSSLGMPFRKRNRFWVKNEGAVPCIYGFFGWMILTKLPKEGE